MSMWSNERSVSIARVRDDTFKMDKINKFTSMPQESNGNDLWNALINSKTESSESSESRSNVPDNRNDNMDWKSLLSTNNVYEKLEQGKVSKTFSAIGGFPEDDNVYVPDIPDHGDSANAKESEWNSFLKSDFESKSPEVVIGRQSVSNLDFDDILMSVKGSSNNVSNSNTFSSFEPQVSNTQRVQNFQKSPEEYRSFEPQVSNTQRGQNFQKSPDVKKTNQNEFVNPSTRNSKDANFSALDNYDMFFNAHAEKMTITELEPQPQVAPHQKWKNSLNNRLEAIDGNYSSLECNAKKLEDIIRSQTRSLMHSISTTETRLLRGLQNSKQSEEQKLKALKKSIESELVRLQQGESPNTILERELNSSWLIIGSDSFEEDLGSYASDKETIELFDDTKQLVTTYQISGLGFTFTKAAQELLNTTRSDLGLKMLEFAGNKLRYEPAVELLQSICNENGTIDENINVLEKKQHVIKEGKGSVVVEAAETERILAQQEMDRKLAAEKREMEIKASEEALQREEERKRKLHEMNEREKQIRMQIEALEKEKKLLECGSNEAIIFKSPKVQVKEQSPLSDWELFLNGFDQEAMNELMISLDTSLRKRNILAMNVAKKYILRIINGFIGLDVLCDILREECKNGHMLASRLLGVCYMHGVGIGSDLTTAASLFLRAAKEGDGDSMSIIGLCFKSGVGVPVDLERSLDWFKRGGRSDNASALNNLGLWFQKGIDGVKAIKCFNRAIELGNANAYSNLAWCYYNGCGVEKNLQMAKMNYEKGASKQDTNAMLRLAWIYEEGVGCEVDLSKSLEWYRKAANLGDTIAMVNLGKYYMRGKAVNLDDEEAVKWIYKAAQMKDPNGMAIFGYCCEHGNGVEIDLEMAVKWYERGFQAGNTTAGFNLARCYENGIGVEKDLQMAESITKKCHRMKTSRK